MTALVMNEELQMLQDSARGFIQKESPVEALRTLRDSRDEKGYSLDLWRGMVDMGWTALTIPEEYGGLGYDYIGLGPIMQEIGRSLVASPFFATIVLGSTLVQQAGNDEQKADLLPAMAAGDKLLALALEEGNHHAPTQIATQAIKTDGGYALTGSKTFVIDGHIAETLIVPARTSGSPGDVDGITLFLVDAIDTDVEIERSIMVDSRNAARITLNKVSVPDAAILGQVDQGFAPLEKTLDIGRVALSAEMLGLAQEAFDRTANYLKTRKQFGQHIGSFQALQHRAAQMFCELELCKSAVLKALMAIDEGDPNLPQLASVAKYTLGETTKRVTRESIQMFGGIGMTDEEEIGFFTKRAMAAEMTLGGQSYHADRFASLRGY